MDARYGLLLTYNYAILWPKVWQESRRGADPRRALRLVDSLEELGYAFDNWIMRRYRFGQDHDGR